MQNTRKPTKNIIVDPLTGGISFQPYPDSKSRNSKEEAQLARVRKLNPNYCPIPSKLDLDKRIEFCLSIAIEPVTPEACAKMLQKNKTFIAYDGFEPSGRMHIAQGVMKAINVNKLVDAGGIFVFWVADWFALMNNKMWGDLDKIQIVGRYFIEVWKAVGMKMSNVKFLWTSDEVNADPNAYWLRVMDIARKHTIPRVKRCCQIMGRDEDAQDLTVAQLMYPCMQAADVFFLNTDICQLGDDQRKVNMLAYEYASGAKDCRQPIVLGNIMIPGLKEGMYKMSKSDPDSAIFMEDTEAEIRRKIIKKAYCKPQSLKENPVLDWFRYFVMDYYGSFEVVRSAENGGNKVYYSMAEVNTDFENGDLHPRDLKENLVKGLNDILIPVRKHFETNTEARRLFGKVKEYQAMREKENKK
jgi:tyrosyl-tRNA synthetase